MEPLFLSSGLELLKLSLKRGVVTCDSYMIRLTDAQELRETSPYLVAKFYSKYHIFMIGPSFAPIFRKAVQQSYLRSPAILEGIYMAMFTAVDRSRTGNDTLHPDFAQGAVSLQQLRTTKIMGTTDALAILALGQSLAAFDLLTKCVDTSLILRYSLSSIQPWYQELSKHQFIDLFAVASIFWDTSWSLLRREYPVIKFCPPKLPIVDRLAGLCTTLLPILYDLCVIGHKIKHKKYAERQSFIVAIERIKQRILAWTATEPDDLAKSFSKEEILGMKTQVLMYQNVALLIAHRMLNPIGTQDDTAWEYANSITLEFLTYQALAGNVVQLQQVGFPILIAALELAEFPDEIWDSIPLFNAAPQALIKLKTAIDYVWTKRRHGYNGYMLDLVDGGPDFVVIP
ncbi:hypothetical protein LTR84_000254 [Exophiala bonariae]|uniref:Transcription factor domain-containing protein n=1 Tax=Exophiala bonariae TaxID=1690606 RepID=A0AAV9NQR7_9EURO|nr:hypothetical protein LTR84_000254 [Exophiala bonariae]